MSFQTAFQSYTCQISLGVRRGKQLPQHKRIGRLWITLLSVTFLSILLTMSPRASADPTWGVGMTWVPKEGVAVGVKIISKDEEDSYYGSLGIDYLIRANDRGRWRPNIGVGYQSTSVFGEVNVGYRSGEFDWGLGVGYSDNEAVRTFIPEPEDPGCPPLCFTPD